MEQGSWEWQNPLPQGNVIYGIWGSSENNAFAIGAEGTILHYDGSSLNPMESGTSNHLRFFVLTISHRRTILKP